MTGRSSIVAVALALLTLAGCMSSQANRNTGSPQQGGGGSSGSASAGGGMGGSGGGSSGGGSSGY